ncbi:uncharacterized protein LOC143185941 [Calliopsis andreniformis]|uniref:uncharacterized protein LOC143185941 n=1 Tax=Calliopsis andreniformis TaxID=337506 RepID=UPI003FCE6B85
MKKRTSKPRQWPVAEWRINPSPITAASRPRSFEGFLPRIVAPNSSVHAPEVIHFAGVPPLQGRRGSDGAASSGTDDRSGFEVLADRRASNDPDTLMDIRGTIRRTWLVA